MADDDEGSGTTLIIIFIILLLCGCGAFYFFYYRYTTGWTTISDVSVDPSLKKPDATGISLYKAQKTAYDNNNLAFFIVSNGASTYDVYYYPPGKNAPKPVSGKATLYYKNAPTSSSSSDASSSATSGGSSGLSGGSSGSRGGSSGLSGGSSGSRGGSSSATSGGSSSATSRGSSSGSSSSSPTSSSSPSQPDTSITINELSLTDPTQFPWGNNRKSSFRNELYNKCKSTNLTMRSVNALTDKEVYDNLVGNKCPPVEPTCKSPYDDPGDCSDRYSKNDCEDTTVSTGNGHNDKDDDNNIIFVPDMGYCTWG